MFIIERLNVSVDVYDRNTIQKTSELMVITERLDVSVGVYDRNTTPTGHMRVSTTAAAGRWGHDLDEGGEGDWKVNRILVLQPAPGLPPLIPSNHSHSQSISPN